jgi:aminocarboxymuconate-semialdehyde decarboxylase
MVTRREVLGGAGAMGGVAFVGCSLMGAAPEPAHAQARRREVVVNGRRVKTVDVHCHCALPEAMALMGVKPNPPELLLSSLADRIQVMDQQGIDVEALSINPFWYKADREVASRIIAIQNEGLAKICAAQPERFVAFATVALQHPDLAVEQLVEGVKKYGLRGLSVGGSVNGEELAAEKFHPVWAKAEELGLLVFIHPQGTAELRGRLAGNGGLDNVIGNPLETTIALSHLIFEGTLDRFPGLKKHPTEYLKQMYFDSIVFTPEALAHLIHEVGAGRIVIGTDHPFPWMKTAVDHVLATPGLNDAERAAMLGGTACQLLGIAS